MYPSDGHDGHGVHPHHYETMEDMGGRHPDEHPEMSPHGMPYSYAHGPSPGFTFAPQPRPPQGMAPSGSAVPLQAPSPAGLRHSQNTHMHGHSGGGQGPVSGPSSMDLLFREVWAEDLEDAMAEVRQLVKTYKYIGMDTEFPGVVARPVSQYTTPDMTYQLLRCNVDLLKIIQLGLTFSDGNGNYPTGTITYQFNFHFDLDKHMWADDSIKLLERSGLNFQRHRDQGIKATDFG